MSGPGGPTLTPTGSGNIKPCLQNSSNGGKESSAQNGSGFSHWLSVSDAGSPSLGSQSHGASDVSITAQSNVAQRASMQPGQSILLADAALIHVLGEAEILDHGWSANPSVDEKPAGGKFKGEKPALDQKNSTSCDQTATSLLMAVINFGAPHPFVKAETAFGETLGSVKGAETIGAKSNVEGVIFGPGEKPSTATMDADFTSIVLEALDSPGPPLATKTLPMTAEPVDSIHPSAKIVSVQTHFEGEASSPAQQIGSQLLQMAQSGPPTLVDGGALDGGPGSATTGAGAGAAQIFEHAAQSASKPSGPLRKMVLELSPERLGAVRLSMRYSNDRIHVDLAVERPHAIGDIMSHSADIRAILAQSGVSAEAITITAAAWGADLPNEAGHSGAGYSSQRNQKRSDDDSASAHWEAEGAKGAGGPLRSGASDRRSRGDIL